MKKFLTLCAFALLFVLVACVSNTYLTQEQTTETLYPTPTETSMPQLFELSQEREFEIRRNFCRWMRNANITYQCVDYQCLERELSSTDREGYFGTFNGYEIVSFIATADLAMMSETIAGYEFRFGHLGWSFIEHYANREGDGVHIWLHDDGDFMCICIGYERGYLTAEDIGVIWARHQG